MAEICMKAQSSMLLIIIVIMIFVGMVVFLLGLANTVSNEEFTRLYVNNLLISTMRTDTGYTDSKCKLVSDLIVCACFARDWICGDSGITCGELANRTVTKYMVIFANQTKSMKYLFLSTPEFVCRDESGNPANLVIGDVSLKKSKDPLKITSYPVVIGKTFDLNRYTMKIQLIVANR
jgi:hypothetical protein